MEIIKEGKDRKEPIEPVKETGDPDATIDKFMYRWRMSEFYPFVHKIIDSAISQNYLQEVMEKRYVAGESMSNDEIGEAAKTDFQTKLRIQRDIKDALE